MPHWNRKISTSTVVALCLFLAIATISASQLVTAPRIFFDEAITIEIARNFQLFGVPDVLISPGHFPGFPYITGSSGYPVYAPLAVFYELFGFGFVQARVYALALLMLSLATIWFFVRRFWNASFATAALALIAGFASLYDSGRRVMGDVPGFAFMLLGLIFLLKKERAYLAGVLFGLAVVTKPSVYLLIIPALILTHIISDWRSSFRRLLPIGIGAAAPIFLWVLLQFPNPHLLSTWSDVLEFYRNSFGSTYSPWTSILHNLKSFASQSTLLYFTLISIPTILAFRERFVKKDPLILFLGIYGVLDLLYFLKSTGTIRYLLPLELILLLLLPATSYWIVQTVQSKIPTLRRVPFRIFWLILITGASILHLVQFLYFSSVLASNASHLQALEFLSKYKTQTIGVIDTPHIAAFLAPEQKLHYLRETDQIIFGTNPLGLPLKKLPTVLVIPAGYQEAVPFTQTELTHLARYTIVFDGRWKIYELRP